MEVTVFHLSGTSPADLSDRGVKCLRVSPDGAHLAVGMRSGYVM